MPNWVQLAPVINDMEMGVFTDDVVRWLIAGGVGVTPASGCS
jgi:hypothetical protein